MQMSQPHKMNINIKNNITENKNLLGLKLGFKMDVDGSSKGSECPDYGYDNGVALVDSV